MKNVLILGAGASTPYLISYLLDQAQTHDWAVTVADRDLELAMQRVNGHPRGKAVHFDMDDLKGRGKLIAAADLVVNLMPAFLQPLVAEDCVANNTHMVSASYRDPHTHSLDAEAKQKGLLLLTEAGLDPGIDNMSAREIIRGIRERGGYVEEFLSYGSGVPEPDAKPNPLRYCITWNPRNVVMAAEAGAQYLVDGKIKIVPWRHVFHHTWPVEVDGVGTMEAYPNRDSLSYLDVFGLKRCKTMIRGTLRYPGYCETWAQVLKLGLPNEKVLIPNMAERTWAEVTEMFLPRSAGGTRLEGRVANHLGISATGRIMSNLRWLGLFSDEPIGIDGKTPTDAMISLLYKKLPLTPDVRDMVTLVHEMVACFPEENNRRERIVSTFKYFGEPGGMTAMAKTVGMPAAIVARLVLTGKLTLTGSEIPTHDDVCPTVLAELATEGMTFTEQVTPIDA